VVANSIINGFSPFTAPAYYGQQYCQRGTPKEHIQKIQQHLEKKGIVFVFLPVRYQDYDHKGIRIQFWQSGFLAHLPNKVNPPILPGFSLTPKIRLFTAYYGLQAFSSHCC